MSRDITQAFPVCEPRCPPFASWDVTSLVFGRCPECGRIYTDDTKFARAFAAKALLAQIEDTKPEEES